MLLQNVEPQHIVNFYAINLFKKFPHPHFISIMFEWDDRKTYLLFCGQAMRTPCVVVLHPNVYGAWRSNAPAWLGALGVNALV